MLDKKWAILGQCEPFWLNERPYDKHWRVRTEQSQGSHSFFLHAALEKIRTPITSPFLRCIIWYNYKSLEKLIWQFPCWYSIFPHYYQTHCSKPLLFTFFILSHQIIIEIPSICELNTHLKAHISHHFSVSSSPSSYYCPAFSLKNSISRLCYPSSVLSLFVNQEPL